MEPRLLLSIIGLLGAGAGLMACCQVVERRGGDPRRSGWIKYGVFAAIIVSLLLAAGFGRAFVAAFLAVVAAGGALELGRVLRTSQPAAVSAVSFLVLMAALGHLLWGAGGAWYPGFVLVLLVVAVTDSYSQLWGRLMGRHKLCPRISPNKTVEGAVGGVLTALITVAMLSFLFPEVARFRLVLLGLLTAGGALAGDLVFSALKRRAGTKDFSRVLPGQGGILDRFDSLVVAAPVFAWSRLALLG
jgi:phosphatidate cytidylyltransferase